MVTGDCDSGAGAGAGAGGVVEWRGRREEEEGGEGEGESVAGLVQGCHEGWGKPCNRKFTVITNYDITGGNFEQNPP